MQLTAAEIVGALGAPRDGATLPAALRVATDTRAVEPGDAFVALRGERHDGHAYLATAFERGAALCIVEDYGPVPAGCAAIAVADTRRAYLLLARAARATLRGPVIAISGSAGKTTSKAYLATLLDAAGAAVAVTPENENNEIGVAKVLLSLERGDARTVVVEMGARHYGDLDPLVDAAQPHIALLTNIGDAHLEIMGSRERLAHTKWGLFRGGARALLNLADAESRARRASLAQAPLWFGIGDERPPAGENGVVVRDASTIVVSDACAVRELPAEVRVPGDHNRRNLAAALVAAWAAGVDPARTAPHARDVAQPARRYETVALGDGRRVIFDAYNASLSGTLATLDAFAAERAARRIAVLGSMAELGADAPAMHRRVGAAAVAACDVVLAGGDFGAEIERGARDAGGDGVQIVRYDANAAAVDWLRCNARAGDAILLKGSRKYRMEEIVDALRERVAP